jgi:hypothetical protein
MYSRARGMLRKSADALREYLREALST